MADLLDRLDKVEQDFEQIRADMVKLDSRLRELQGRVDEVQSEAVATLSEPTKVESVKTQLGEVLSILAELTLKVVEMGAKFSICNRVMSNASSSNISVSLERTWSSSKLKIPEPKAFEGKWEAKDIDNFLWQMEQYFEAISIDTDLMKIRTAVMYLKDMAILVVKVAGWPREG